MTYSKFYDSLYPIYLIVKDREFTSYDIPKKYRKQLRSLANCGYLIRVGSQKVIRKDGRSVWLPLWRISFKFLGLLSTGNW